jgi:hypothetical protein
MTNALFAERAQVVSGFVPVNMASGAPTSDWVSLKNYEMCTIVFFAAAGTNGDDPTLTVLQGTAVGGTTTKALTFTRIDVKQGSALNAIGQFTKTTQAAANTYTDTDAAEEQKIWVVSFRASELDTDNGYDCIRGAIGDVGTNSQLGCVLYILEFPRYSTDPLPSAIAD